MSIKLIKTSMIIVICALMATVGYYLYQQNYEQTISATSQSKRIIYMSAGKTKPTIKEEVFKIKEEVFETKEPRLVSLGTFKLTAYCSCSTCCGKWSGGPTASGVMPKANRTIAVDRRVIPFGTEIVINGITYVAEDTGGAIKGNRIDIYMDSHQAALNFGVRYAEVFKVVD